MKKLPYLQNPTKNCPQCFMTIPIKATRCGQCPSEVSRATSYDLDMSFERSKASAVDNQG